MNNPENELLEKMRNIKSITLINRKHSTVLPRMEVSITKKQSMQSDWISASESLLE